MAFEISVGTDNVHFTPKTVKSLSEFLDVALNENWTPAVFKDNYRRRENFLKAEVIGLDFDDGLSIADAEKALKEKGYKYVLMPTRNHGKEKNGKVADRFRVLLFLSRPITTEAEYYATINELHREFPQADPACKDPSRLFYPSTDCVSHCIKTGKAIDPVEPVTTPATDADVTAFMDENRELLTSLERLETKGELSRKTLKFMLEGARPGQRHQALYKAARDYHQNNYSKEQFIADLQAMIDRTGNWASKKLSAKDLGTIEDAFKVDPKHEARMTYERAFIFEPIGEVLNCTEEFEWLVDGFLSVGGISIIAGDPKAGKSTLVRQLIRSVAKGQPFLLRDCKQGNVYYLALEEQRALLKKDFKLIGINESDPIRIHVGSPMSRNGLETLQEELDANEVALLVVDTFMLGLNIKEPNSYTEVNEALTPYRDLARDTGTHIVFIHHSNKTGTGSNAISGSKAIAGAVDALMVFKRIGKKRFITTEGRGIKPWFNNELIFDFKSQTYALGDEGGFGDDDKMFD